MSFSKQFARHFRETFFGPNMTGVNLKDTLEGITLEQAYQQVNGLNTIVKLTYHIQYYVQIVLRVLEGGELKGSDKYSFDHPDFTTQAEWDEFVQQFYQNVERFAEIMEEKPDTFWDEPFKVAKYGNYYRNIQGIIEHSHYHMGQISLVKKLILE